MTILTWELRNFASCLEDSPRSSLESQCLFVMWGRCQTHFQRSMQQQRVLLFLSSLYRGFETPRFKLLIILVLTPPSSLTSAMSAV